MMNSSAPGNITSLVQITYISRHGAWIPAHDKEMPVSNGRFPWFEEQAVKAIANVEAPFPGHFTGQLFTLVQPGWSLITLIDPLRRQKAHNNGDGIQPLIGVALRLVGVRHSALSSMEREVRWKS